MKNVLFSLVLWTVSVNAFCQGTISDSSQQVSPNKVLSNVITLNLLPLFANGAELNYGRFIKEKQSIFFTLGYYLAQQPYYYTTFDGFNGLKVEIQLRFYLDNWVRGKGILYVSSCLQYKHINLYQNISYLLYTGSPPTERQVSERKNIFASAGAVGILIGSQRVARNSRYVFDTYLGTGILIPLNDYPRSTPSLFLVNPYEQGFFLKIGLSMGFVFN